MFFVIGLGIIVSCGTCVEYDVGQSSCVAQLREGCGEEGASTDKQRPAFVFGQSVACVYEV